jgi:competence protein ComEC
VGNYHLSVAYCRNTYHFASGWSERLGVDLLRAHFLNVGHGDCTIIEHPSGRLTMIDINNSQEFDPQTFAEELAEERQKLIAQSALARPFALSPTVYPPIGALSGYAEVIARAKKELTDPIEFLKRNYPGRRIWRFVLTHPDLDHMRGLKRLYENVGFENVWDTDHTKPTPQYRSEADKEDWEFYQRLRSGALGLTALKGSAAMVRKVSAAARNRML